jgi:hypothetical protein
MRAPIAGQCLHGIVLPALLAVHLPFCATDIRPTVPSGKAPVRLWSEPAGLAERDLFVGPWGLERAPDPAAVYTLVQRKHTGINPGLTVVDPLGREWSVKQAPPEPLPDEAQVEVVVSRILSGVGYYQPPVYYLPAFTLQDDWGTHQERGGRLRLKDKTLKDRGEWSWHQNPFVGSQPLQGLLAILMVFNSSDIKSANNTIYEHRADGDIERWYVVRDVGTALGSTGRIAALKGDADAFGRQRLLRGVDGDVATFNYRGRHRDLVVGRISRQDLGWAADLLARLSEHQWYDAFRAGGYGPDRAKPFIDVLQSRIAEAQDATREARRIAVEGP